MRKLAKKLDNDHLRAKNCWNWYAPSSKTHVFANVHLRMLKNSYHFFSAASFVWVYIFWRFISHISSSFEMSVLQSKCCFFRLSLSSFFVFMFCLFGNLLVLFDAATFYHTSPVVWRFDMCVRVCMRASYKAKAGETRRFIYRRVISRAYVLFCVRTEAILRSWIVSQAFSMLTRSKR